MPSLDDILGNPLRPHGAPRSFASVLADPAATPRPFSVIVEDPPWKHGDQLPGAKRGAGKHYDVMPTEAICALALPPIAPDAHLFLWRVASMQQDALDVVRARGFTVKSELVWLKRTKNGKRAFGMGHRQPFAAFDVRIGVGRRRRGLVRSHDGGAQSQATRVLPDRRGAVLARRRAARAVRPRAAPRVDHAR
jgi:hypothetical protein